MADRNPGKIEFELVSPTKLLVSQPVDLVVVPGTEGDIGVLPGHSQLIATVRPGVIEIHEAEKIIDRIFVGGGFAEVSPERCTVLAEEAVPVADIDPTEANSRLAKLKEKTEVGNDDTLPILNRQLAIAEGLVVAAKSKLPE